MGWPQLSGPPPRTRSGVVRSQASHSSNVSSCLIRKITYFSFSIGLMCVSVHIKVYKYIFLINVLYFLAWTKYLEKHFRIHSFSWF